MKTYSELWRPGKIGKMEVRNRFVMPPMFSGLCNNGYVTERQKAYYEERARGGVGMIIVEDTAVEEPKGWSAATRLRIDDDRYLPGLTGLTHVIHSHGPRVAAQLGHLAVRADSSPKGYYQLSPSPVRGPDGEMSHTLTEREITGIVDIFARAAGRAKQAGFDGVEIHGAHRFLLVHFLSPAINKRSDKYGGNLKGRARFFIEVVQSVRRAVGPDFPVWCRINGEEANVSPDVHLAELPHLARLLEAAGADALHVSGANPIRSYFVPSGYFLPAVAIVKQAVKIPVIVCGGMNPEEGEKALKERKADFVSMGRCLIADPRMPEKLAQGKPETVTTCIRCLECMNSVVVKDQPVLCSVNASAGREQELSLTPARRKKRIVVVGGGPAGMTAAGVAAQRGHVVTLIESASSLGGQMRFGSKPPHKGLIASLIDSMSAQLAEARVNVHLGEKASADAIVSLKPEVVLIATGVTPIIPKISGVHSIHVFTAEDVLAGRINVGKKVAVIGGGLIGCETALFLADRGKSVIVIELLPQIAAKVIPNVRDVLLAEMKSKGITTRASVTCEQINATGLVICNSDGVKENVPADTVVLAVGGKPNQELAAELNGKVHEVHLVGDAGKQENILCAVRNAAEIACAL